MKMIPQNSIYHIDGLVQDCSNTIANALELLQSRAKPLIKGLRPVLEGYVCCHNARERVRNRKSHPQAEW